LQHTLVITHSNQGLNQIFEKIIHLDVDERHCLRLGHGEEALATDKARAPWWPRTAGSAREVVLTPLALVRPPPAPTTGL